VKKWAARISAFLFVLSLSSFCFGNCSSITSRAQSSPFVLPIVKRDSLLNGLHLITLEQHGTGNVAAHLRINSGGLFDLAGKGGLAEMTVAMLPKGCTGLTAKNVAETVEQSGLSVGLSAGWDSTDIVMSGPVDSLETIFDLMGRLLMTPSFDQKEFEALKAARLAELTSVDKDDSILVKRKAVEAVFGSHPFGRLSQGSAESIGQITRQDLIYFHTRYYLANNSELAVTGEVTADQVTRLARTKLGAWKKGDKIPPTFKSNEPPASRKIIVLDRSDSEKAIATVAQIGLSRRAEDYFAAMIMTDLLGQQLTKAAAAHAGTSIQTELEARFLAGPMILNIKSTADDLPANIDSVLDAMTAIQSAQPASDLVEAAKGRLIASLAERLKTPAGTAAAILDIETFGLGRDYMITYADRVNAVAPSDIQRAAQSYLKPKSVTVVIAGPASKLEAPMKKIGTVVIQK